MIISLILMLKTLKNIEFIIRSGKKKVGDDGDDRAKHDSSKICGSKVNSGEVGDNEIEKKGQKTSKFKNCLSPKNGKIFDLSYF